MLCDAIAASLSALVDGELRGWHAWRVRRHLAHCAACQKEFVALTALNKSLKRLSPVSPRRPICRPIGLVRPALAALAVAGALGLWRMPAQGPPAPVQVSVRKADTAPTRQDTAQAPQEILKLKTPVLNVPLSRPKHRRKDLSPTPLPGARKLAGKGASIHPRTPSFLSEVRTPGRGGQGRRGG